jgi:hypothetical protein
LKKGPIISISQGSVSFKMCNIEHQELLAQGTFHLPSFPILGLNATAPKYSTEQEISEMREARFEVI